MAIVISGLMYSYPNKSSESNCVWFGEYGIQKFHWSEFVKELHQH